MVTTENLLAVISNIHGINIITRNKMKGALQRNELDVLAKFINEDPNKENPHIRPEVQVVLSIMLSNLR